MLNKEDPINPVFCTRIFAALATIIERQTMLIHPMAERLRDLGLTAMADAFLEMRNQSAADDLSREDWLGLLIDREATARDNKRLGRRLTQARLRQNAVIEDADLRTPRGLDRGLFQMLTTCRWIRDGQHVLIGGPTGVGKSWLACALGHKACRDGFSVLYRRAPRLFADLATARGEGRLARLMRTLERTRLLIIDDWGPEPLSGEQRRDLLEIVDDRDGKGSLLITSQVPVVRWHEIIGDPTLGDAILDRVIHRAHRIELQGESLRKRQALTIAEGLTNAKET
jgi:DNA replication protein DnaC